MKKIKERKDQTNRTRHLETARYLRCINRDNNAKLKLQKNLIQVVNILGYDTQNEYRYAHCNYDYFTWLQTKDRTYRKERFDVETKKKYYEKENIYLIDIIIPHCFPLECKNYSPNKIAITIDNKEQSAFKHYVHQSMWALYTKKKSNILILDIDNHSNNPRESYNKMKVITNHFRDSLIYMEKSFNNGYHLFIKLDKEYEHKDKNNYIIQLTKKLNISSIEVSSHLRLPFSYHYEPCDSEGEIFTVLQSIDRIQENFTSLKCYSIDLIEPTKEILRNLIPFPTSIFMRENNYKSNHITPDQFIATSEIRISEGHRHKNMWLIIKKGKFNGWTIDQIIYVIHGVNNGTSKDLKVWSKNRLRKEVEKAYNKCNNFYKPSSTTRSQKPDTFMSNAHLLPTFLNDLLNNDKYIDFIIKNCNYKITDLNRQKFRIVLKEMFGSIIYDTQNNRKIMNSKNPKLLIGKQFSKYFALKMKEYYESNKIISKIDTYTIMHSILNDSTLFSQYKTNDRGWNFININNPANYCKQYDFINNKSHIKFNHKNTILSIIVDLFNKLYYTIFNNFIISDFFIRLKKEFYVKNDFLMFEQEYLIDVG